MNRGNSEIAPARSTYRNVTYVVQTSVLAEDNDTTSIRTLPWSSTAN